MNNTHWATRITHWFNITPPLRPNNDTINVLKSLVGNNTKHVLVLGVTPELCSGFDTVTAVDKERVIIDQLWHFDSPTRQVIHEDWFRVSLPPESFSAVVGDGSLNMVSFPHEAKTLLQLISDWLEPGGVAAIRMFGRPNEVVSEEMVRAGTVTLGWHEWRALLNQHIASTEGNNVPSKRRLSRFDELYPNREELCQRTGWDLQEIGRSMDSYRNSVTTSSWPALQEWLPMIPPTVGNVEFVPAGLYPLSSGFPILTFRKLPNE